jgi:hypothetical protein
LIVSKQQQETDALVVQAAAVLRAIREHDDNCGKRGCCVSKIIGALRVPTATPPSFQSPSTPFEELTQNSDDG